VKILILWELITPKNSQNKADRNLEHCNFAAKFLKVSCLLEYSLSVTCLSINHREGYLDEIVCGTSLIDQIQSAAHVYHLACLDSTDVELLSIEGSGRCNAGLGALIQICRVIS